MGFLCPIFAQTPKPIGGEGNLASNKIITKSNTSDFYLRDIFSEKGFIKFSLISVQNTKSPNESIYKSTDARYRDWSIIFNSNNRATQQWQIIEPKNLRTPNGGPVTYCVTVSAFCDGNAYTISCYSECSATSCVGLFKNYMGFSGCTYSW